MHFLLQKAHALFQQFLRRQRIFDADVVVCRDPHRRAQPTERPLYIGRIHVGTNQQPDCRVVFGGLQQLIYRVHVKVQLADKFRLKRLCLQLAGDETTQADMVKQ